MPDIGAALLSVLGPFGGPLVTVALMLVAIGIFLGIRNPRVKEEAISALPWIVIGAALFFGAPKLSALIVSAVK